MFRNTYFILFRLYFLDLFIFLINNDIEFSKYPEFNKKFIKIKQKFTDFKNYIIIENKKKSDTEKSQIPVNDIFLYIIKDGEINNNSIDQKLDINNYYNSKIALNKVYKSIFMGIPRLYEYPNLNNEINKITPLIDFKDESKRNASILFYLIINKITKPINTEDLKTNSESQPIKFTTDLILDILHKALLVDKASKALTKNQQIYDDLVNSINEQLKLKYKTKMDESRKKR